MKKISMLTFFLFLIANVVKASVQITSLPFTCDIEGETYIMATDLPSTSGAAITVSADNITINGNGKILTFGVDSEGDAIVLGNVNNTEIHNITIIQGSGGGNAIETSWYTPNGINIHDNILKCEQLAFPVIYFREPHNPINNFSISNNIIMLNDNTQGTAKAIDLNPKSSFSGRIAGNTITVGDKIYKGRNSGISIVGGGDGLVEIYDNTLNMNTLAEGEGIRLYGADNNKIYNNTLNMNCFDCRGILLDGGSDNNFVLSNTINMNIKSGGTSIAYGLRIRFASSNNKIYSNIIDTSLGSGTGKAVAIGLGGVQDETPGRPSGNRFYNNIINSNKYFALYLNQGSADNTFCNNTINATATTTPLYIRPMNGDQNISNLEFCNNTISYDGQYAVWFDFYYAQPENPVAFCDRSLTPNAFRLGEPGTDYTISTEDCPKKCIEPPQISEVSIK